MAQYTITNEAAPINFECDTADSATTDGQRTARILQNAKNLLRLRMGDVPYDRLRGFDASLFGLPLDELNARLLPEIDRVLRWEPRAEAISATARLNSHGDTIITVVVEIQEA